MIGDVEVNVYVGGYTDFGRGLTIAIVREGNGVLEIARVAENGALVFHPFQDGMMTEPTIHIHPTIARKLVAALIEAQVKPPTAGAIEGELKATKYHLEDLRKMLKVNK